MMTITIHDETRKHADMKVKDLPDNEAFFEPNQPNHFFIKSSSSGHCCLVFCFSDGSIRSYAKTNLVIPVDATITFTLPKGRE